MKKLLNWIAKRSPIYKELLKRSPTYEVVDFIPGLPSQNTVVFRHEILNVAIARLVVLRRENPDRNYIMEVAE